MPKRSLDSFCTNNSWRRSVFSSLILRLFFLCAVLDFGALRPLRLRFNRKGHKALQIRRGAKNAIHNLSLDEALAVYGIATA